MGVLIYGRLNGDCAYRSCWINSRFGCVHSARGVRKGYAVMEFCVIGFVAVFQVVVLVTVGRDFFSGDSGQRCMRTWKERIRHDDFRRGNFFPSRAGFELCDGFS